MIVTPSIRGAKQLEGERTLLGLTALLFCGWVYSGPLLLQNDEEWFTCTEDACAWDKLPGFMQNMIERNTAQYLR